MDIFKGLENIAPFPKNTAVAIGNFDGVHLGHQEILKTLVKDAQAKDLISVVLTFSPHPKKVVGKDPIRMIQSLAQRLNSIQKFKVQTAIVLDFTSKLAGHSAEGFIRNLVLDPLRAEEIIVGKNFCFGKNRSGSSKTLVELGKKHDFQARIISPVVINRTRVSSSLIRRLLREGYIEEANSLLGHSFEIAGTVIKGKRRGKSLGFPTANIRTDNEIIPKGVFLSQAVVDNRDYPSLTNVGICPTFGQNELNVESFLMNFDSDIYGKRIQLLFLKKIRDEEKFASPQDLSRQLRRDLRTAHEFFHLR